MIGVVQGPSPGDCNSGARNLHTGSCSGVGISTPPSKTLCWVVSEYESHYFLTLSKLQLVAKRAPAAMRRSHVAYRRLRLADRARDTGLACFFLQLVQLLLGII